MLLTEELQTEYIKNNIRSLSDILARNYQR